jgi:hypothetical protein
MLLDELEPPPDRPRVHHPGESPALYLVHLFSDEPEVEIGCSRTIAAVSGKSTRQFLSALCPSHYRLVRFSGRATRQGRAKMRCERGGSGRCARKNDASDEAGGGIFQGEPAAMQMTDGRHDG